MAYICSKPKGYCTEGCEHYHFDVDHGRWACFAQLFDELKYELYNCEVVASEALPGLLIRSRYHDLPREEIQMLLEWSGDDQYITVDEVIARRNEIMREKEKISAQYIVYM